MSAGTWVFWCRVRSRRPWPRPWPTTRTSTPSASGTAGAAIGWPRPCGRRGCASTTPRRASTCGRRGTRTAGRRSIGSLVSASWPRRAASTVRPGRFTSVSRSPPPTSASQQRWSGSPPENRRPPRRRRGRPAVRTGPFVVQVLLHLEERALRRAVARRHGELVALAGARGRLPVVDVLPRRGVVAQLRGARAEELDVVGWSRAAAVGHLRRQDARVGNRRELT